MRPLEIITVIVLIIYIVWPLTGRKLPPAVGILPAFAVVIVVTHANIEGMRWQMIPIYVFAVVTFFYSVPAVLRAAKDKPSPPTSTYRIFLILGLLIILTALPILLPVPSISPPNGPYKVGTRIYELTDSSRDELYSAKDEPRRFMIQLWYPSDAKPSDQRAPWMQNADVYAPTISKFLGLPSFFLDHLALVKVPAYIDTPIVPTTEGYPVVLFSHGWNGFNAQNTSQALNLASHGYIVVGIQHPYGAVVTVFQDGTVVRNDPSALPEGVPDEEYKIAAQKLVNQWAGDISYALDFIEAQNNDSASPLYNSIDTSKIGAYGHSTGGGATIRFCGTDERCKALLGQDPFMRPVSDEVVEHGVTQPSFFMFSQSWADETDSRNNQLFDPFYKRSEDPLGSIYIDGTKHYDFSDLPLLSPLAPQLGLKGPINGKRVTLIVNDYLLSFFDAALKGKSTEWFQNPSSYPEVHSKE